MKKSSLITIIIILAIIIFSYFMLTKDIQPADEQLAKCLGSKSQLYVREGCLACEQQKQLFGSSYKHLSVVDCAEQSSQCLFAEIQATPTWIINGKRYEGIQTIEKLKEYSGC